MGVLVDILYSEKCCNKGVKKISYETCKQCEYKVALSKTFVTCYLGMNKNNNDYDKRREKFIA